MVQIKLSYVSCFLSCFVFATHIFAQQKTKKFDVLLSPAYLSLGKAAVQAGIAFPLGAKYVLLTEVAFPLHLHSNNDFDKVKLLRAGIELKRSSNTELRGGNYVSFQMSYSIRKLTQNDPGTYEEKRRDSVYNYSSAVVRSPVFGQLLKIGKYFPLSTKTYLDFFLAAGVREIFTNYKVNDLLLRKRFDEKHPPHFPEPAWRFNYTKVRFHGAIGLRVGVKF